MANYCCVEIEAKANENIIPKLFEKLTGNIPAKNKQRIFFLGFEAAEGTQLKINGMPNRVPSNGYFITPYNGERFISIQSVSFDKEQTKIKIWFIY